MNSKKRNLIALLVAIVLTITIVVASVIQVPAVETANNQPSRLAKTETKTLDTNAEIDDAESELMKLRAILVDEAKKDAQDSVKEHEDKIKTKSNDIVEDDDKIETQQDPVTNSSLENESIDDSQEESYEESSSSTYVAGSSNAGYLLDIDSPDSGYKSFSISLSSSDRDAAERIIMGEAGSMGYEGMALVAQCLRDAYISGGYSSIRETISSYGYYGSMSITPSQTCKDVVKYIFDNGGSAVQHRILVFYNPDACTSSWHESQNYILSYGSVRFFDRW